MMDTKEQIRTALIEIAEALGRPHYEPLTVREVLASFDKEQGIHFKMIHPAANATKKKADDFKRMTGWTGRTNEHARDAAMLVFKRFAKF